MADVFNLGTFLGLEMRARSSTAPVNQASDPALQANGEARGKSWRDAWQRAIEQSQGTDWAGWFVASAGPEGARGSGPLHSSRSGNTEARSIGVGGASGLPAAHPGTHPSWDGDPGRFPLGPRTPSLGQRTSRALQSTRSEDGGSDTNRAGFPAEGKEALGQGPESPLPSSDAAQPSGSPIRPLPSGNLAAEYSSFNLEGRHTAFTVSNALTRGLAESLSGRTAPDLLVDASALGSAHSGPSDLVSESGSQAGVITELSVAVRPDASGTSTMDEPGRLESLIPQSEGMPEVYARVQVLKADVQVNTPIRLTAEASEYGVRIWLGINPQLEAEWAPELTHLTRRIQQWLASQGERLISVICNGREVWRDTLDAMPNRPPDQASRPPMNPLPHLIPRKPV